MQMPSGGEKQGNGTWHEGQLVKLIPVLWYEPIIKKAYPKICPHVCSFI